MKALWMMTVGLAAVAAMGESAADLAARGILDPIVITNDVAADATATLTAPAAYSERTTLVKTGAGTLVLPASAFEQGKPARVQIASGTAVYTNDLPVAAPAAGDLSDAVKSKLAYWGSVKDTDHLVLDGDGLERLYDVREEDTAAPRHVYLQAEHFNGAAAPTLMDATLISHYNTVTNIRPMAFFGNYGSGIAMKFLKPDGAAYKRRPIEASAVYGFTLGAEFGFLFGNCMATAEHTVWNLGTGLPWHDVWGPSSGDTAIWIDGMQRDRSTAALTHGFHAVHERFNTLPTGEDLNGFENALFSHAAVAASKGGQYVGEVMFFTNRLTDVERVEVQRYLGRKWSLSAPTPARVELAAGTTLEVEAGANEKLTANLLATGKGMVVKKGAGTLSYRPEAREAVTPAVLDLQEGDIAAAGAFTLKARAGMKVTSVPHDSKDNSGTRVSVGNASSAHEIEKVGAGYAAIDSIPAGTERISVKDGTLALRSVKGTPARYEVAIPNGRFEDWGSYADKANIGVATLGGAWSASGAVGFYHYDRWMAGAVGTIYGASVTIGAYGFDKYPPIEGRCVLMLKVCNSWAEVAVPFAEGGEYELRFLLAGRSGSANSRLNVILRASDNVEYEIGKSYLKTYNVWTPQVFRFRVPCAGTHRIRFFHLPWLKADGSAQWDYTVLVNGLHLHRVGDGAKGWKIPFGDCETTNTTTIGTAIDNLTGTAPLEGWTFDTTVDGTYSRAGLASTKTYCEGGRRYGCAFNGSHEPFAGDHVICIRRTGGWASTTFTPPAGRWYLRAYMAQWGNASSTPNRLLAALDQGGTAVDLGELALDGKWMMRPRTWPNAFTVDGATPVTLTVTSSCASGMHGAYLDNFELVAACDDDDGELVKNGDFEAPTYANAGNLGSRTDWTIIGTKLDGESNPRATSIARAYGRNDSDAFGYDHGSGYTFIEPYIGTAPSQSGICQDIVFPRAGWYRLSYLAKGRSNSNGTLPSFVYLVDTSANVSNRLDRFSRQTRGVYEQRTSLFHVEGACTRRLVFLVKSEQGGGYLCLDDVSIRRVGEEEPFDFHSDVNRRLSVSVADGAFLHLDYVGTNVVTSFRACGRGYEGGVVDQTNCEAITGPGALLVKPCGLQLIIR